MSLLIRVMVGLTLSTRFDCYKKQGVMMERIVGYILSFIIIIPFILIILIILKIAFRCTP